MGKYKAYEEYKDSGVEWLGQIPTQWLIKKLKFICKVKTGSRDTENAIDDGQYPFFVRSQNVERIDSVGEDCEAVLTAGDGVGVGKVFHYYIGKFDYHQRVYMLNNFTLVLGKFVYYYLSSNFYKVALEGNAKSTVDSLRLPQFLNFELSLPNAVTQKKIIEFLDYETAKIDELIEKQQNLIKLLKEKRQAVISHAVTKGLDPDAPMKDSGVEWLGEVPKHWGLINSKWLFAERKLRANIGEEMLTASQKHGIIPQKKFMELEGQKVVRVQVGHDILKLVEPNDFVISMRSFQGGIEFSAVRGAVSSAYVPLVPASSVYVDYFKYLFKSGPYIQALQSTTNLVRDGQALRFANFSQIDLPVIDTEEQKNIANYLLNEIPKINSLIDKAASLIELFKERREALISAAVTGKIDVCDWQPPKQTTAQKITRTTEEVTA